MIISFGNWINEFNSFYLVWNVFFNLKSFSAIFSILKYVVCPFASSYNFKKFHLSLIVHLHTKNQNGPSITAYQTILQFQLKVFRKKHFNSFWYMWSILTLHSKQFLSYSRVSIIPRKTLITISFFLVCLPLSRGSKWFIDSFWRYCWSRNTESWLPRCILSYN